MHPRTLIATVAALLIAVPCQADTYSRQPGVDAVHYVFRLALDDGSDRIAGEASVRPRLSEPVKELLLDLTSEKGGKGMLVRE